MLTNYKNYGPYEEFVQTGSYVVNVNDITLMNWDSYFDGILNILRDGIETDFVHNTFISVDFGENKVIELSITDYFFNVIMWYLIIRAGQKIEAKHLFFNKSITRGNIKAYIDEFFIDVNRKNFDNIELNNIIDDTLARFAYINEFAFYLANTINLEDDIKLMNACPEYNDIMHADLSNVAIEDVKSVGMELTNKAINFMKNSKQYIGYDHCLADSWRANEGINAKQYKEFAINIGSKPNGQGGVYPAIINKSFLSGGVDDYMSYFIESSTGRTAQIMSKTNVGDSGHFARLLGLNNTDVRLHHDPNHICNTKNFQVVTIKNETLFRMYRNRYYRLHPMGVEYKIGPNDKHLIGQTIYVRSPMTCASASRGEGVCYRCYGDLAYANRDINIGKMAAEEISSKLTQILLSAKHLLETKVKKLEWSEHFFDYCEINGNMIKLLPDTNFKGYYLIIDPDSIELENEDDYRRSDYEDGSDDEIVSESYNEYVTEFEIEDSEGYTYTINTRGMDKLYISMDLNEIIRKKGEPRNNKIAIPLGNNDYSDIALFFIVIHNNELSKTMDELMDILDKNSVTQSMDRNQLLQAFIETIDKGGLNVSGVHCEVILSNQIRSIDDILEKPQWEYENEPYEILTLNKALTNNPSVVVSLLYQRLSKLLYNPLTFRKHAPSFMDLFFMEKPQEYLNSAVITPGVKDTMRDENRISAISYVETSIDDDD